MTLDFYRNIFKNLDANTMIDLLDKNCDEIWDTREPVFENFCLEEDGSYSYDLHYNGWKDYVHNMIEHLDKVFVKHGCESGDFLKTVKSTKEDEFEYNLMYCTPIEKGDFENYIHLILDEYDYIDYCINHYEKEDYAEYCFS